MICGLSSLDSTKLETIRAMEQRIGKTLLAFTCHDIAPAELTEGELDQISEAERKLGLYLVAVKS